jgi:hypothetical protein
MVIDQNVKTLPIVAQRNRNLKLGLGKAVNYSE